jgi:G3E family GTPase
MASTSTISTPKELQDQFLSMIRKSQEIALDAIKTMVDSVQAITPKVPAVDLPFVERLPKPHDVVVGSYDFAEKLLTSQRKFADEVVKATAPLMPGKGTSK